MELIILKDIVIIFALSVLVMILFHKIKLPPILGFFLTGIIAGPQGLSLINEVQQVEILAEIGIIFLLFTIALEFSLEKFSQIKKQTLLGGSLQMAFTFLIVFIITWIIGFSINESIFTGFLISFSSTAIVMRLFQEKNEIDTPQGRTSLGILIFQDVAVVPVIILTPILAGVATLGSSILFLILEGAGVIIFTIIAAKWIVPYILYHAALLKNRELFLLTTILICFGITWLTTLIGLSPALGAFLAGLIISNTDYAHQALGNVMPFHDIFMSFFFVSIGMLLNLNFFLENILLIIGITLVIVIIKSFTGALATYFLGFPLRIIVLVGLILSQIGEFSFILSEVGIRYGLISETVFQLFLAVSVITMALTPFLIAKAPNTSEFLQKLPFTSKLEKKVIDLHHFPDKMQNHLVIVGFGVNGKNVAMAAQNSQIDHVVVEINPAIVKKDKDVVEHFIFGDAAQETILKKANIQSARIMVVAISDPVNTRRITELGKRINSDLYIIVRTRYIDEIDILKNLGADDVIPEEFETSVKIFSRVLDEYDVPLDKIHQFSEELRKENYGLFQNTLQNKEFLCDLNNPSLETSNIKLNSASVTDKILKIDIEKKFEVNIKNIIRDQNIKYDLPENMFLEKGDILTVSGSPESIIKLRNHFE